MTCPHLWTLVKKYDECEIDERDQMAHTAVVVLGCPRCRRIDLFPPQNAALITERYQQHMRADLARQGWEWPA